MMVKFITVANLTYLYFLFLSVGNAVVTLALVSGHSCVISLGTQLGVSIN